MKQFSKKSTLLIFILQSALIFSAPIFSEPPNLSLLKSDVKNYHDSGLYEKELAQVAKKAQKYILGQVALNNQRHPKQKLALVLDIDETSLSNYQHMVERDFTGTRAQFHQDILAANAPAIKPTLALYKAALRHGVNVFFVTGRPETERGATEKNLIRDGYTQWSGLYLRPEHYKRHSIIPFKTHARELIMQKGYVIVATVGDQYSDLKGGYAQKGFKLPNPYYYLP